MTASAALFESLRTRLEGALSIPGDDLYTQLSTPWNVAVATSPAAVVQARTAADVVAAVRFANETGMAVAVQSTGHGIAETLDGALLVHTGLLDECDVHPDGWARVGAGARWRAVLDAAAPHGYGAMCGSSPEVGVVGYTTGGGFGPVARTYGLASDCVTAIEVVTGDGEFRRVTAGSDPDLFWALRGGKGALGIVTALEFDLIRQPDFYGGALFFDGADARTVLHAWRTWSAALPEAATSSIAIMQLPPLPGVPEPLAGRMTVSVRFAHTGDHGEGKDLLAPMREVAPVLLDGVDVLPFAAIGAVHTDPVDPMPTHEDTDILRELTAETIDALLAVAGPGSNSPQAIVELRSLSGAASSPAGAPDAVSHRGSGTHTVMIIGALAPPIAEFVAPHAQAVRAALAPWATGYALPNFGTGVGAERLNRVYDAQTLERLTSLARRYDPKHVLRAGQVPVR